MIDTLQRDGHIEGVSASKREQAVARAHAEIDAMTFPNADARRDALHAAVQCAERHAWADSPEHRIWQRDLEADNFTVAELCEVITGLARRWELATFALDAEALAALVAAEDDKPERKRRGMARVVLDAAGAHDPPFTPSKPDLARALARYAVEHPRLDGAERAVLTLAEHLVRLTYAGRQVRGRLRR